MLYLRDKKKSKQSWSGSTCPKKCRISRFGDHEHCGEWCRYSSIREEYRHVGLPNRKPLTDPQLKSELMSIFTRVANNSDKLAPCGSSQGNESFNNSVASKTSKCKYYAGSESLNYRVAAAVSQKNIGVIYIQQVISYSYTRLVCLQSIFPLSCRFPTPIFTLQCSRFMNS